MTEPGDEVEDEYEDDYEDDYRARRRWMAGTVAGLVVLAGLGVGLSVGLGGHTPAPSPEGVPVQNVPDLAPAGTALRGAPIDGIPCQRTMSIQFHIHTHLDIFVNGAQKRLPAGAGIVDPEASEQPGGVYMDTSNFSTASCFYWLHVHADDGIIHLEAPHRVSFTLGQFFDVWGKTLSADQVGPERGPVVAFVNGKRWTDDPRSIPLVDHEDVQLDVGSPVVPFKPLKFNVISGACGNQGGCGATRETVPPTS